MFSRGQPSLRAQPSRQCNGPTEVEDSLAPSRDEAKWVSNPEENHLRIESPRSSSRAGCQGKNTPGTEPRGESISLDIPYL